MAPQHSVRKLFHVDFLIEDRALHDTLQMLVQHRAFNVHTEPVVSPSSNDAVPASAPTPPAATPTKPYKANGQGVARDHVMAFAQAAADGKFTAQDAIAAAGKHYSKGSVQQAIYHLVKDKTLQRTKTRGEYRLSAKAAPPSAPPSNGVAPRLGGERGNSSAYLLGVLAAAPDRTMSRDQLFAAFESAGMHTTKRVIDGALVRNKKALKRVSPGVYQLKG